ncbi:hypothetical protein [Photobacterium kishitanii]|uniref:Uncharacterized protein n=1 Tax=Photobacterium kishitanii TaxID=318456 RepID=A0A2T3KMX1_9GAMM|nr:hypothetical protein [Photobacterium kishitanii]PSV01141.1 hypothetical protein C9J27_03720 [Photobacterium kishitanii]
MRIKTVIKNTVFSSVAVAITACLSASAIADDSVIQMNNQNETYTCSAGELNTFIRASTTSLFAAPEVPNAKAFTEAKAQGAGENGASKDDCMTLFSDLSAMEDLQKVMKLIQTFSLPTMPSMDGVAVAAQALAKRMVDMAMNSVCNAATKKAAMGVINKVMERQAGFDINDVKSFDSKKYAKDLATEHATSLLRSKGIDDRLITPSKYKSMFDDNVNTEKNKAVDAMFK